MRRLLSTGGMIVRRPGLAGLLAATFALGMALSFVVPFLSLWGTQHVRMSSPRFGIFMTVTTLSAILLSTVLARKSDSHLARQTVLLLGAGGGMLGYAGYAFLRDPVALMIVGSTVLALASVCFSQLFAHVRETFTAAENGEDTLGPAFLTGVVRACFSFAWTVGPALGALMMERHGFRGVFLGAAMLYLLFFLGVWRFVPHRLPPPHAATTARPPLWRVLARGDIAAAFVAFLLFFAAYAMNMLNLPLMVTSSLGGTERDVGLIFCVGPVVEIPLMLWFGQLAARGHQLRLIRIGAVASLAYFLALSLAQAPWHIYPIQILSGAVFAIMTNVAILFYQDLLPGQAGLATSLFGNAINVGNLAGFFCFGVLVKAVGHTRVPLVCAGLAVVTLTILVLYRSQRARD